MTEWRVVPDVKRFMLQSTLHQLVEEGFDIHELTYVQPIHDVPSSSGFSRSHDSAGSGDFYCVIAVKY